MTYKFLKTNQYILRFLPRHQSITSVQEEDNLVKSICRTVNELVLLSALHATFEHEVDMHSVDPILFLVPKSIRGLEFHFNWMASGLSRGRFRTMAAGASVTRTHYSVLFEVTLGKTLASARTHLLPLPSPSLPSPSPSLPPLLSPRPHGRKKNKK
jgi:hypothetical protein